MVSVIVGGVSHFVEYPSKYVTVRVKVKVKSLLWDFGDLGFGKLELHKMFRVINTVVSCRWCKLGI